jgi:hypothetical protein
MLILFPISVSGDHIDLFDPVSRHGLPRHRRTSITCFSFGKLGYTNTLPPPASVPFISLSATNYRHPLRLVTPHASAYLLRSTLNTPRSPSSIGKINNNNAELTWCNLHRTTALDLKRILPPTSLKTSPKPPTGIETENTPNAGQFSAEDSSTLFAAANLNPLKKWQDPQGLYSLWMLERPGAPDANNIGDAERMEQIDEGTGFGFPSPLSAVDKVALGGGTAHLQLGNFSVPTLPEWATMWRAWDTITLGMIPPVMLHQQPIDLRHRCLFYLGHIPAYAVLLFSLSLSFGFPALFGILD